MNFKYIFWSVFYILIHKTFCCHLNYKSFIRPIKYKYRPKWNAAKKISITYLNPTPHNFFYSFHFLIKTEPSVYYFNFNHSSARALAKRRYYMATENFSIILMITTINKMIIPSNLDDSLKCSWLGSLFRFTPKTSENV